DGIRDFHVTGVQTCALPISLHTKPDEVESALRQLLEERQQLQRETAQLRQKLAQQETSALLDRAVKVKDVSVLAAEIEAPDVERSEERRVGKECRGGWGRGA